MKIELKNFKFYPSFSEETNAFTSDVFVDGKKVAYAKNEGNGGNTSYDAYPNQSDILKRLESYANALPDVSSHGFTLKMDLEMLIDDLVSKKIHEAEIKKTVSKLKKECSKKVLVVNKQEYYSFMDGLSGSLSYRIFNLKTPYSKLDEESRNNVLKSINSKISKDEVIVNEILN